MLPETSQLCGGEFDTTPEHGPEENRAFVIFLYDLSSALDVQNLKY
jgi:hypothetical protein